MECLQANPFSYIRARRGLGLLACLDNLSSTTTLPLNASLQSIVSHLTHSEISSLMHLNNWRLATLRSLSNPPIPPADHDRLAMLRALIRDPTPFPERLKPGDSSNTANVALARLSWPSTQMDIYGTSFAPPTFSIPHASASGALPSTHFNL